MDANLISRYKSAKNRAGKLWQKDPPDIPGSDEAAAEAAQLKEEIRAVAEQEGLDFGKVMEEIDGPTQEFKGVAAFWKSRRG